MNARDHATIEELLSVRALGGLDGHDLAILEQELAEHGPTCEECRRLETDFNEIAGRLAFALGPLPVDRGMVDRILETQPDELAARRDADRIGELGAGRAEGGSRRTWLALVGVAATVLLLVGVVIAVRQDGAQPVTRVAPGQRFVPFEGDAGELAMAYTPGEPGVVVWGWDLPDPGPGRVYEIWMVQDDGPISGGCVTPQNGRLSVSVDADIGIADVMAVTVEPASCPAEPSTDPVFTASLA
jgi:hypothetical protein